MALKFLLKLSQFSPPFLKESQTAFTVSDDSLVLVLIDLGTPRIWPWQWISLHPCCWQWFLMSNIERQAKGWVWIVWSEMGVTNLFIDLMAGMDFQFSGLGMFFISKEVGLVFVFFQGIVFCNRCIERGDSDMSGPVTKDRTLWVAFGARHGGTPAPQMGALGRWRWRKEEERNGMQLYGATQATTTYFRLGRRNWVGWYSSRSSWTINNLGYVWTN